MAGEGYYQHLLESIKGKASPAVKQIELDLLRTLPDNKHYQTLDADGVRDGNRDTCQLNFKIFDSSFWFLARSL